MMKTLKQGVRLSAAGLLVVLLLIGTVACKMSPTAILEEYEGYETLSSSENSAGVSISKVEYVGLSGGYYLITFGFADSNNATENNANVLAGRFQVADAESPGRSIDCQSGVMHATTTSWVDGSATSTESYFPMVQIPKAAKVSYAIVAFEGITADENGGAATEPLFFIVELDEKAPKVLTETPLRAPYDEGAGFLFFE
jgi:hypothetical protein